MVEEDSESVRGRLDSEEDEDSDENYDDDDRLSALPDSLLLHIFSFLHTVEVMRTCVLSKRWQFLWSDSSEFQLIDINRDIAKTRSFVDSVGRILVMCSGTNLNRLYINFWYQQCFNSNVNLWIQFAVKNKVKDFTLVCTPASKIPENLYVLPGVFYSNSSFTALTLGYSPVAPRGAIEWGSLKSLSIQMVELTEFVFQKIFSGCPVLECVRLSGCWGFERLEICSPSVTTVAMGGFRLIDDYYVLRVSAPYVRVLSVSDNKVTWFNVVGSVSSLVTAKVDYRIAEDFPNIARFDTMLLPDVKQSLESFRFVKELELGPWCIEILSRFAEKGWHLSPSTRLCLRLTAWRNKRSIAGILNILKSSPNIETLVIGGMSFESYLWPPFYNRNQASTYLQDDSLDLVLRNLKTVEIRYFSKAGRAGEPMLTLVQLLLKSAIFLDKMVIDAKYLPGYSSTTCYSAEFTEISLKLLSFPRSSPKAVVLVR